MSQHASCTNPPTGGQTATHVQSPSGTQHRLRDRNQRPRRAHAHAGVEACPQARAVQARLHRFLGAASFPCVGARAALARGTLQTVVLGAIGSPANDAILLDAIIALGRRVDAESGSAVHGLAAVFAAAHPSEVDFEQALWEQLQRLHALDRARGHRWATDVSSDPDSRHFSMSLGAHPYFVVGLDPDAPRLARRFCWPTLVFNSHRQFQRLKADGRYRKMQDATRQRDRALQGDINPNLADYGQRSEARQYSGRELPQSWRCPLRIDA